LRKERLSPLCMKGGNVKNAETLINNEKPARVSRFVDGGYPWSTREGWPSYKKRINAPFCLKPQEKKRIGKEEIF